MKKANERVCDIGRAVSGNGALAGDAPRPSERMPLVEGGVKDFDVQQRRLGDCGAIRLQAQKPAQGGHEHS